MGAWKDQQIKNDEESEDDAPSIDELNRVLLTLMARKMPFPIFTESVKYRLECGNVIIAEMPGETVSSKEAFVSALKTLEAAKGTLSEVDELLGVLKELSDQITGFVEHVNKLTDHYKGNFLQ